MTCDFYIHIYITVSFHVFSGYVVSVGAKDMRGGVTGISVLFGLGRKQLKTASPGQNIDCCGVHDITPCILISN